MPLGTVAREFANRVADAVAGLLNRPINTEVRLISQREIGDHRDLTIPRAEAREAFNAAVAHANSTIRKADAGAGIGANYSQNLLKLNEVLEGLQEKVLSPSASPKAIRAAEAALVSLSTAVAVTDHPEIRAGLKRNDFARTLASHAAELDKSARALRAEPGFESVVTQLQDVAESLRQDVRINYLQQPLEAYSLKEIANYKALHYDSAVKVVDGILTSLKERALQLPLQGGEVNWAQPVDSAPAKLHAQIKHLEQYKLSLEERATEAKSEVHQSNDFKGLSPKLAKSLIGGKSKLSWHAGPKTRIENNLIAKRGRLGKPFAPSSKLHLKTALAAHLDGFLKGQGIEGFNQEDLTKQIGSGFRDGVESQPWTTIKHELKLLVNNRYTSFQNTLTPARALSPQLAQSYAGLQGISSLSNAEPNHPVNLWRTSFKTEAGKYAFSGLRHGVHDAYDIENPAERIAAADRKVAEFIQAAVQSAPELPKQNPDGSYTFNIVSASLLTPSRFNGEDEMLRNQLNAYQRANDIGRTTGIPMQIQKANGELQTITVRPNIIGFNTGVNTWSLSRNPLKAANAVWTWRDSDRANDQAIEALIGSKKPEDPVGGIVGEALESLRAQKAAIPENAENRTELLRLSDKIILINKLVDQIKEITNASRFSDTSYHQIGQEPYKLPIRILALANEIGATPAFNCKSGKDRTGQLDVEVKDFYAHLNHSDGRAREVNHVRRDTELDNFKKIFEDGGAREIQKFNTGIPGSKIDLKFFYDILGYEKKPVDPLVGLSKWVGS
jgi:hypothetical protein